MTHFATILAKLKFYSRFNTLSVWKTFFIEVDYSNAGLWDFLLYFVFYNLARPKTFVSKLIGRITSSRV
jgi:hypothetical protein